MGIIMYEHLLTQTGNKSQSCYVKLSRVQSTTGMLCRIELWLELLNSTTIKRLAVLLLFISYVIATLASVDNTGHDYNTASVGTPSVGVAQDEAGIFYPKNIAEIKKIVSLAQQEKKKIYLVGSGLTQSFTRAKELGFMLINLKGLNKIVIDAKAKTAQVFGNVTFQEVEQQANAYALATKVRPTANIFVVLASISTNVHGWDHKNGCIGSTIQTIHALDSTGQELVLPKGSAQFKECVGSFGSIYMLYGAVIELTDNLLLAKVATTYPRLEEALDEFPKQTDNVEMALINVCRHKYYLVRFMPASKGAKVSNRSKKIVQILPFIEKVLIDLARLIEWTGLRSYVERLYEKAVTFNWIKSRQHLRNEFMNVNLNATKKPFKGMLHRHAFGRAEYLVKQENLDALVTLIKKEYERLFLLSATIRFVKADTNSYCPYANADMYALEICWEQREGEAPALESRMRNTRILEFLTKHDGRFNPAYPSDPEDIVDFYPPLAHMIYERNSIFSSPIAEAIKKLVHARMSSSSTPGNPASTKRQPNQPR
ncbi:hypothetical protein NEHOM01_1886 [Nematocida homosporus]|uniref:uncharacterized protein n=1 Tax=Nematocida homosporus TaxID=1912981 RepID=UPI00221E7BE3|nr:uncharacterized protein NEHOM01_1886 [Nematocida homosporus]KAI5187041.1 hypothetical protein NEHOM01_1886 [Nematocida homosporus]